MLNINKRKQVVLVTALLACLGSPVASADEWDDEWDVSSDDTPVTQYKEGNMGMGGGALFGAITGKLMGRHQGMERVLMEKDAALKKLQASLSASQQRLVSLQQQAQKKNMMVASLGNTGIHPHKDISTLLQGNFVFTVQFRTDSNRIESHLITHVRKLARALRQVNGIKIHLQGFADTRGAGNYNLSLSQQRVEAVKTILLQEGIAPDLIVVTASGENSSLGLGQDLDSMAFDRRVVIRFEKAGE